MRSPARGRQIAVLVAPAPDAGGAASAPYRGQGPPKRGASEWVLTPVTRRDAHHYSPFVAAGGARIGYHRCRSHGEVPTLERHDSPIPGAGKRSVRGLYLLGDTSDTGVSDCCWLSP